MQNWGHLVRMSMVIAVFTGVIWYSTGWPIGLFLLVPTEYTQFWRHTLKRSEHPIHDIFEDRDEEAAVMTAVYMVAVCTLIGSAAMLPGTDGAGVVCVLIGQMTISEIIDRANHAETMFHSGDKVSWSEAVFYLAAIAATVGGITLLLK